MKKLTILLILTSGLLSCNHMTEKPMDNKPLTAEQQKAKLDKLKLEFDQPVLIDSSIYVMYPLILKHSDEPERSYGSSSSGSPTTYWNIIFYNTGNGQCHLLNDSLKIVIYSYNPRNVSESASSSSSSYSSSGFDDFPESGYNQVNRLIYYSITTTDFNKDGKLNSLDPGYLFISDKAGRHFKQISPDNMNVESWKTIKGTNKILIMVTKDTNGDKKFDAKDETIPFVYDLAKNTISTEIFNDGFKMKLKKQLDEKWTKKE